MSTRFSEARPLARHVAGLLVGGALAALLQAATLEPQLKELDEVLVIGEVPVPIEDYVEYPQFDSVVISPGGTHLATAWRARLGIVELPSMKPRGGGLLMQNFGIADLRWIDENRLSIQPDWPLPGFRRLRESLGTLMVVDLNGRMLRELNPFAQPVASSLGDLHANLRMAPIAGVDPLAGVLAANSASTHVRDPLGDQRLVEQIARQTGEGGGPLAFGPVRVVDARTARADQLLFQTVWSGDADKRGYGVFELDLAECKQVRVTSLPLRGGEVITGPDHRPALVTGVNEAHERVVYFLPEQARAGGEDWELVVRSGSGERGLLPLAWTGEDEKYYALDGRYLPTRAVVVWNARDNTRQVLYQHPDADMDTVSLDPAGQPWLFSGVSHYPVHWYPDPAHPLAALHRALVQRLPQEHVDFLNATDDLATAVVRVSAGARPPIFLVVDVKTGSSITGMHTYPKLRGRRLSPVEAIEFAARDGLVLHGYLTRPLNSDGEPRRDPPLLVIAHDGPSGELLENRHVADSRYDFERQLFASRGYAVLQVNVRGTAGRGVAFQQAGDGEWGRTVQDDYADAVRWAIEKGVAAADRVCFYGTGYGAYSALMAAVREPDLFQCVIGVAGVYDLSGQVRDGDRAEIRNLTAMVPVPKESECFDMAKAIANDVVRPRSTSGREIRKAVEALNGERGAPKPIPSLLQRAIGNDLEELRARSPSNHASSIKAKVLLVHQFRDSQVAEDQLAAMRRALRAARNPAETDTIGDERDGYYGGYFDPQLRANAYKTLLGFLDKQIGN